MRKTTFLSSLGLALLVGGGVAVSAQPPAGGRQGDRTGDRAGAADSTHRGRRGPGGPDGQQDGPDGRRGPGGGRGPEALLLRGITLSESQKQQVAALREQQRARRESDRPRPGAARDGQQGDQRPGAQRQDGPRQRGQRPDSATMAARRQQFEAQRTRDEAALRAILTPAQRRQFDANRAELEQRMRERQAQGGPDGARGPRGDGRGRQG